MWLRDLLIIEKVQSLDFFREIVVIYEKYI